MKVFKPLSLLFFVLSACHPSQYFCSSPNNYENIKEDRFYDRKGWFSLDVIHVGEIASLKEPNISGVSSVSIINSLGELRRVEVSPLPDEIYCRMLIEHKTQTFLNNFLQKNLEQLKNSGFPDMKLVHQESLDLPNSYQTGLYAVVMLPKGGTLQHAKTGAVSDSLRGFLFFLEKNWSIVISYQESPINVEKIDTVEKKEAAIQRLKQKILKIKDDFRLERS